MEEAQNLLCKREEYTLDFPKTDHKEIENKLKEQAIKDGFKLRKPTGAKNSTLYYICHRGGQKEEKETQAKRSKSSIKISIHFLLLI